LPKRLLNKCIQKLFYQVSAEHNLKLFLAAADSAAGPIRPCMAYSRSQNARQKRICARPERRSLFGGSTPFFSSKKKNGGETGTAFVVVGKEGRAGARNISLRHFPRILRIISIACLRFSVMLKGDKKQRNGHRGKTNETI